MKCRYRACRSNWTKYLSRKNPQFVCFYIVCIIINRYLRCSLRVSLIVVIIIIYNTCKYFMTATHYILFFSKLYNLLIYICAENNIVVVSPFYTIQNGVDTISEEGLVGNRKNKTTYVAKWVGKIRKSPNLSNIFT